MASPEPLPTQRSDTAGSPSTRHGRAARRSQSVGGKWSRLAVRRTGRAVMYAVFVLLPASDHRSSTRSTTGTGSGRATWVGFDNYRSCLHRPATVVLDRARVLPDHLLHRAPGHRSACWSRRRVVREIKSAVLGTTARTLHVPAADHPRRRRGDRLDLDVLDQRRGQPAPVARSGWSPHPGLARRLRPGRCPRSGSSAPGWDRAVHPAADGRHRQDRRRASTRPPASTAPAASPALPVRHPARAAQPRSASASPSPSSPRSPASTSCSCPPRAVPGTPPRCPAC